jgi:hypothetical protein
MKKPSTTEAQRKTKSFLFRIQVVAAGGTLAPQGMADVPCRSRNLFGFLCVSMVIGFFDRKPSSAGERNEPEFLCS